MFRNKDMPRHCLLLLRIWRVVYTFWGGGGEGVETKWEQVLYMAALCMMLETTCPPSELPCLSYWDYKVRRTIGP